MKMRTARGNAIKFVGAASLLCAGLILWGEARRHIIPGKSTASALAKPGPGKESPRWAELYGKLPLSFEENQGQTASEVRYVSHGRGYELFLTPQEAVLALPSKQHYDLSPLHRTASIRAMRKARTAGQMTAMRIQLDGANPNPGIAGIERLPGRVNYFIGNDPKKWHTDVPAFARVKYAEVYPGVDLVFYGNQQRLEYDFIVAPGADPQAIRLKIAGAHKMRINSHGELVLSVADGEVELEKPLIYQKVGGERREIAGNYIIDSLHRVTFSVPSYDRSAPLILDPVLNYSTYLGGTGPDTGTAIAVDSSGNAFIVGQTMSRDFPAGTNGAVIATPAANQGASFVAELDPTGANLLYSTYLAGSTTNAMDSAFGVAVDPAGKVYVAGFTFATNFPTTSANAFNAGPLATNAKGTVYLTKLDPKASGTSSLIYSTYIAGTGGEYANAIAADAAGNAYVAGLTDSTDFPTQHPLQSAPSNAKGTAFLTRIDTTKVGAASLIFSTYFGGNGVNQASYLGFGDAAFGVVSDSSQHAYLVGATSSTNSPATFITSATAYQAAPPAANTQSSAFVSNIDTTAGSLIYSTYLAGSNWDQGFGIALGPSNVAYVTGSTTSTDFPVAPNPGAFDTTGATTGKAFVALVVADGTKSGATSVPYSTYLGGTNGDNGYAIKADASGNAYVAGTTASSNFPLTPGPLQATLLNPNGDAFIAKLNPVGGSTSDLLYATYYGGSGDGTNTDQCYGIAIDAANPPNAYVTGVTFSNDLPVFSALPKGGSLQGPSDAYVAKVTLMPTLTISPSPFDFGVGQLGVLGPPQQFVLTNNTSSTITFNSIVVKGVTPAANTDFAKSLDGCTPSVADGLSCKVNVTFTPSVVGPESATLMITAVVTNGGQSGTEVFNVNLTGTGSRTAPKVSLAPSMLNFANQILDTPSTAQPVTLNNTGTGPLTVNSIGASGDFAATSTGANACPTSPATLAAGATCTINVTFAPTVAGARTGTLTVMDNAAGSPQTVSLTGTGVTAPSVGLAPPGLTFTGQMLTTTSTAQPITLQNTGGAPLTINSVAASGDFAATSTGANACPTSPATLAAGATCTINVTFAPVAVGARTGTLTITDNGSGSPQTASLTGTGWDFQVTAPSSATGKSPLTFNATMTPLGGFNQSVGFTCMGAPAGTACTVATPITAADGKTAQSVLVTITRTSNGVVVLPPLAPILQMSIWQILSVILALLLLIPLSKAKGLRVRLSLATAVALLVLAGCSSGPSPIAGSVTITGTSGGSGGSVSRSATVAVTVN
jgi:Abnormal spindle-like microcephaly-assoc'd, ASPM-SPD-2-Hydin/Beta-propeller repeat